MIAFAYSWPACSQNASDADVLETLERSLIIMNSHPARSVEDISGLATGLYFQSPPGGDRISSPALDRSAGELTNF